MTAYRKQATRWRCNNNNGPYWSNGVNNGLTTYTTALSGSATTCFDNSLTTDPTHAGVGGAAQHYSYEMNSSVPNCALSFRFQ